MTQQPLDPQLKQGDGSSPEFWHWGAIRNLIIFPVIFFILLPCLLLLAVLVAMSGDDREWRDDRN